MNPAIKATDFAILSARTRDLINKRVQEDKQRKALEEKKVYDTVTADITSAFNKYISSEYIKFSHKTIKHSLEYNFTADLERETGFVIKSVRCDSGRCYVLS